ncbi:hypothetical protein GPECTOR_55g264 [Gonium pectorale]|uniref:Uncharacterized protein n=1 Tax=Gonium pectorale TaxID=33097 RepID=A0A150G6A3_GONPE|nr:hypothetical protein GPECTOR_55g264 [Gonium pectorale]|eukprot:KXZ45358.1 hypothetical protein GPECTOR_55g264 [Gonium pectorale]
MGEFFAQLATVADVYFRQKGMIDDLATLVMANPWGMGVPSYQRVMMSPYSRFPLISFHDLSARPHTAADVAGGEGHEHGAWRQEGYHVSCFEQAVLCKLSGRPQGLAITAKVLYDHMKDHVPIDPLGFGTPDSGPASGPRQAGAAAAVVPGPAPAHAPTSVHDDTALRVLIEARSGPVRNLLNLHDIVAACDAANAQGGFRAGSFTRLSCKVLNTADSPQLHGNARFYATAGAVRSAHVLVALHGAGAANCFFLEDDNGSTALLEIRACGFGTRYCVWPNWFMQTQLTSRSVTSIRFFALNVEDPAQCEPSDYEAAVSASNGTLRTWGGDDFRARDKHLRLRPSTFVSMLRHVGSLLRNSSAFQAAKAADRLHGYAVPGGLALGPLCVANATELVRKGAPIIA